MATTITEVKQKIIDKIGLLLDGVKGITNDDAIIKADKAKMELIDMLVSTHNHLCEEFIDDDDEAEQDEDAE